ncbi:MAG: DUF222 domain-containing protein [Nocardioidaceae bacterium]
MDTMMLLPHTHTGAVAVARAALEATIEAPLWALEPAEQTRLLRQLTALEAQVAQRRLALVAEIDRTEAAVVQGHPNTAGLVRRACQTTPFVARTEVKLAQRLEAHDLTRTALAEGRVVPAQAAVITEAVDRLPDETPVESLVKAEEHLIGLAADHDARELQVLGNRLVEVIDPDHADEILAKQLEEQERRAAAEAFFRMRDTGDGTARGTFKIPSLHAAMLHTFLAALRNPDRPSTDRATNERASTERATNEQTDEQPDEQALPSLGAAFCELLERINPDDLPRQGGLPATVVVTMTLETLLGGLKPAQLQGTDVLLSPGLARRLACETGVIPAVLGTRSEVLDLGRRARFFTPKQRLAATLTQAGVCAAHGCSIPAAWCEAHHGRTPWANGGTTNQADALLLCKRHHTLIHDPRLQTQVSTSSTNTASKITFHRRT